MLIPLLPLSFTVGTSCALQSAVLFAICRPLPLVRPCRNVGNGRCIGSYSACFLVRLERARAFEREWNVCVAGTLAIRDLNVTTCEHIECPGSCYLGRSTLPLRLQ